MNSLTRFRFISALLAAVFLGGGYLANPSLFQKGYIFAGVVLTFVGLSAGAGALVLLFFSLFRARKAINGAVFFLPGGFMEKRLVAANDDFCPLFIKASTLVLLAVTSCALMVEGSLEFYRTAELLGLEPFVTVLGWAMAIALCALNYRFRAGKIAMRTLVGIVALNFVVVVMRMFKEIIEALGWQALAVDAAVAAVAILLVWGIISASLNWDKIQYTLLGKALAPVKRFSCIPATVYRQIF